MQEASAKGKKMANKVDKVSEMTMPLKEYTVMTRRGLTITGTSQVALLSSLPNQQLEVIHVL